MLLKVPILKLEKMNDNKFNNLITEMNSLKSIADSNKSSTSHTMDAIIDNIVTLTNCIKVLSNKLSEATKYRYKQEEEICVLKDSNGDLKDKVYYLERDLIHVDQYSRRPNIEIVGIPTFIRQKKLEKHVVEILNKMGVEVSSYDIVSCHLLKKLPGNTFPNVIVRFIDRNFTTDCLKNRKKLLEIKKQYKYKHLFIIENLCKRTQTLYDHCQQLRMGGDIYKVWTYNGVVNVLFSDDEDELPTKLFHPEDIDYYFDESTLQPPLTSSSFDINSWWENN